MKRKLNNLEKEIYDNKAEKIELSEKISNFEEFQSKLEQKQSYIVISCCLLFRKIHDSRYIYT